MSILANCVEYLETVKTDSCDLLVTDPPYWLPARHSTGRVFVQRTESDDMILITFFRQVFREIDRITTGASAWYIFCDGKSYPIFHRVVRPLLHDVRALVWDKTNSKLGYTWRHQHELVLFGYKSQFKPIPTGDGDVLRCKPVPVSTRVHQAQKPLQLLEKLISKHGRNNMILDPFAGSGSTAIAALNTGNNYHIVEMEETYHNMADARISKAMAQRGSYG